MSSSTRSKKSCRTGPHGCEAVKRSGTGSKGPVTSMAPTKPSSSIAAVEASPRTAARSSSPSR